MLCISVCCSLAALLLCSGSVPGEPAERSAEQRASAQELERFLRDIVETRGFTLGRPRRLEVIAAEGKVLFLRSEPRSPTMHLYQMDLANGKVEVLLTASQLVSGEEKLSPEEKARRERMRLAARGLTEYHLAPDGKTVLVPFSGHLFLFDRTSGKAKALPTSAGMPVDAKFSPDGRYISYVLDYDLYAFDLATQKEKRLTSGGSPELMHGLAEFVAQEEMGRMTGYWWSPDSTRLVFAEVDHKGVEAWYVADPSDPGQPPTKQYYPRPGKNNARVRLGITDISATAPVWIAWDRDKYPYLASVRWEKTGPLTLVVQDRKQQEMCLLEVDDRTGATRVLVREHHCAWVNLDQSVPRWLADGSAFLWSSEREGRPRLELRRRDGTQQQYLTPADIHYDACVGIDEKQRYLFFVGTTEPDEMHVYAVSVSGGELRRLDTEAGVASASLVGEGKYVALQTSSPQTGWRTVIVEPGGPVVAEVPQVAVVPPFAPTTEYIVLAEASQVRCAITRPRRFVAGKKYPVILHVYGGPGHNHVEKTRDGKWLDQWYADHGFIVVRADGRGTPRRGTDWERALYGRLGEVPLADQVRAVEHLCRLYPELDRQRIGIMGWSFGGYLAALGVLRRPDVFRAAVAGAPVADWLDYDTHYTERYLGLPQENMAAYRASSLVTYAASLQRPLLLIHGTADDNVYFRHSLRLAQALFEAGRLFEFVPLSGMTHMVAQPEARMRVEQRICEFFVRHL
ncbi:MAG: peptidase [Gemmataceae bacterium]